MSCGEQTHHYTVEERKTGITMMNTRIIERFNNHINRPVLEIFNSYYEFNRLGSYHGYWTVDQAEKIIEYLQDWIGRAKAIEDINISKAVADKKVSLILGDDLLEGRKRVNDKEKE